MTRIHKQQLVVTICIVVITIALMISFGCSSLPMDIRPPIARVS